MWRQLTTQGRTELVRRLVSDGRATLAASFRRTPAYGGAVGLVTVTASGTPWLPWDEQWRAHKGRTLIRGQWDAALFRPRRARGTASLPSMQQVLHGKASQVARPQAQRLGISGTSWPPSGNSRRGVSCIATSSCRRRPPPSARSPVLRRPAGPARRAPRRRLCRPGQARQCIRAADEACARSDPGRTGGQPLR